MKKNKLEKYESKVRSEPSPEQIEQAKQIFVNSLTPIIEKMLKNPGDIKPVSDSWESLARQAKFGVPRQSTLIVSGESEKKSSKNFTDIKLVGEENSGKSKSTFSNLELELIRQIQENE